jgi:transcriptional regulator with XRE-family HTH domain
MSHSLGERLKTLRKKQKLSRKEFSKQSKIPYDTVVALEFDRTRVPLITTIIKLSTFFKISVDELIKGVRF